MRIATRSSNFRFELRDELIATSLNQLGGAPTPTGLQTIIDATQFLVSQGDGALQDRVMNTPKIRWWTAVTFNVRPSRQPPCRHPQRLK